MTKNPQHTDWDFEEDTNVQSQHSFITNMENNVILNNTSSNINKDESGICAKTK